MAGIPKSITLCFIAKTQDQAEVMVEKWGQYFDDVVYRVGTVKPTGPTFSDARNELLPQVKTDYWFWFDTDDEVVGIEKLRQLVDMVDSRQIDALYLPYEYAHNEMGECIVLQWRERLIRTGHDFKWRGAIHESLISESGSVLLDRTEAITIRHNKDHQSHLQSAERNHEFLVNEYKKQPRDPRTTHYLAMSYFNKGNHKLAIKTFAEHIRTSGWDEDKYRSWFYTGQSYGLLNDNEGVMNAALAGIKLIPDRPECYVLAATAEFELKNFARTLEWLKNAGTKEPPKSSLSAIDPTYYSYKAEFLAALSFLNLGRFEEAYKQLQQVLIHSPNFQGARDVVPLFQEVYDDQRATEFINWLVAYVFRYGGRPQKIFEAIPGRLASDPRLTPTRIQVFPPKKWPVNSIVFFCGQAAEAWGPDTLTKGMGGSEEAVVYLSRELARLGWAVTVFNDRDEEYTDYIPGVSQAQATFKYSDTHPHVTYKPWTLFNPQDEFDVLVVWRHASFFANHEIKARLKCLDLHDAPVGHQDIPDEAVAKTDLFFFKSQFQRDIAAHISDAKAVIAPNGIVPEQFNHKVKRNPKRVVWGSSYDRGLDCLLQLWPRVKEQVPEAELDIYYGWNTFDAMHRNNPSMMKWKWEMIRKMHRVGAKEHGRVTHEELAKAYAGAGIWAYPTEFPEISCITAMKAGAAGLISVTSGFAALAETVKDDRGPVSPTAEDIYTNEERQDSFVRLLVQALEHPDTETERQARAKQYLEAYSWESVAKKWDEQIKSHTS